MPRLPCVGDPQAGMEGRAAMPGIEEEAMRSRSPQGGAPGLEGLLRTDVGTLEASLLSPVDHVIRGPVILPRDGSDAVVLLLLDAYSRVWARAPLPSAIGAQSDPDN